MAGHDAMHRTILVVDIEQSSHPIRTDADQLVIRKALYQALTMAFKGNKRLKYYHEDRGDGVLVLVPPEMPKVRVVTNLINRLEAAVEGHNAAMERQDPARAAAMQIRLRVAVHAGEITHDDHGVVGAAITHTFRLADAPPLKAAFDASPGVCALIVSDWFYNNVVYHNPVARPDCYQRITCEVKETHVSAWMRVPFLQLGAEEPVQAVYGNRAAGPPSFAPVIPAQLAGFRASGVTSPPWPQQQLPELRSAAGRIGSDNAGGWDSWST
jgi:hypothetical protein